MRQFYFDTSVFGLNLLLVVLQFLSPKRNKADLLEPLIDSGNQENESPEFIKVMSYKSNNKTKTQELELSESQKDILDNAPPFTLSIKFSDMKVKNSLRNYSFSTKISGLVKLVKDDRPSTESDLEFTSVTQDVENGSIWLAKGQPSTFVFQNQKRTEQELSKLLAIACIDHYVDLEDVDWKLETMQQLVDQLTTVHQLWVPELL